MLRSKNGLWVLFLIPLWFGIQTVKAQIVTNAQSDFIALRSYKGIEKNDAFGFRIHVYGTGISLPNWSLMVRVNQPIRNSEGKIMDPSRLRIRIHTVEGAGYTLQNIGASHTPVPLAMQAVPILQNAPKAIVSGTRGYNQLFLSFNIIIEGGSYLEALKSWSEYPLNLGFLLIDQQGAIISQASQALRMQIYPQDTPPVEPTYAIQLQANVRNGMLEFKTIQDYVHGVSQLYPNGLSITSTTPYAIQVKTLAPYFENGGTSFPVDAVGLTIQDPNSSLKGTIALSAQPQTVLNGINNGMQARLFDIRYFTHPNDERFLKMKPGQYSVILLYTLIPQ